MARRGSPQLALCIRREAPGALMEGGERQETPSRLRTGSRLPP